MKYLSLFSGIGGFECAIHQLIPNAECVGFSEIDPYAISIYKKHFLNHVNLGDITKINIDLLSDFDLLVFGSPCFSEDVLVTTLNNGLIPIKDIKIGDYVLTHKNRFRRVTETMQKYSEKINIISGFGFHNIKATSEHPFYTRKMSRKRIKERRAYDRVFDDPEWINCDELNNKTYLSNAINTEEKLPSWNGIVSMVGNGGRIKKNELWKHFNEENFWWMIGRYLADGWIINGKRSKRKNGYNHKFYICCGKHEEKILEQKLNETGFRFSKTEERTVFKFLCVNEELVEYCLQFGKGAKNKHLTGDILNLPKPLLRSFLDGFISGDGCFDKKTNTFKIASISEKLIYGLQNAIHKSYGVPCRLYFYNYKNKGKIEGRIVNVNPFFELRFKLNRRKQDKAFNENGCNWIPFYDRKEISHNDLVYNLEVDEDNSYCVNNIVVHNCQDMSISKRNRKGLKGDKSCLFYNALEILKRKKPKYVIMKNVASMTEKDKNTITNEIGFPSIMIDASIVSAQQRKRLFWCNFKVSLPENKKIYLKDILENNVDKKYFINSNNIKISKTIRNNTNHPYRIGEIGKGGQAERIYSILGKAINQQANSGGSGAKTGLYLVDLKVRKLTPIESERVQSFPDQWTKTGIDINNKEVLISDSQRYKCCGNAVNVDVIKHILYCMNNQEVIKDNRNHNYQIELFKTNNNTL